MDVTGPTAARRRQAAWGVAAWLVCTAAATHAAVLDERTLPSEIRGCVATGECTVEIASVFERGGASAFAFASAAGPGYLVRYTLASASHATDSSDQLDTSVEPPLPRHFSQHTPLLGSLWLAVQARYAMAATSRDMVLYFDQVQPAGQRVLPRFLGNDMFPDVLHFNFSRDALLAGEAHRSLVLDAGVSDGDLQGAETLLPCVADGCSLGQRLALIGFGFHTEGEDLVLQFSPHDARRQVYFEQLAYAATDNGFDKVREYLVQPVPLPGAGGLALLATAGLHRIARRRTRRPRATRAAQAE